jgi:hypothetical protein
VPGEGSTDATGGWRAQEAAAGVSGGVRLFPVARQGVGGFRGFTRCVGTVYHRQSGTSSLRWPS